MDHCINTNTSKWAYTCCITGHQEIPPEELPKVKARLKSRLDKLIAQGICFFGVGGSVGFDELVTQDLLKRKRLNANIRIIGCYPFKGYRDYWKPEDRQRYAEIDQQLDKIVYCCDHPCRPAYLQRRRHLVHFSSVCVCYCNHMNSDTGYTVKYAQENGLIIYNMSSFNIKK